MKGIKNLAFIIVSIISLASCRQEKMQTTKQETNLKATQETTEKAEVTKEISELTAEDVLTKSIEKCKSISSIEYTINQKGVSGKYGYGQPKIKATIIQKKEASAIDIGFDKAFIKASGVITDNQKKTPFSFSYDGDNFMYNKGNTRQKSVSDPTRKVTMGKLQQYLFMIRIFPFVEDEPYKMPAKSNEYDIKLLDKEEKQGLSCYKIETSVTFKAPNGKDLITKNIWWISELDYLPRAYSDGFVYKDIVYKKMNEAIPKSFFSLENKNTSIDYLTSNQVESELAKAYLLPEGTIPSRWYSNDQFGKEYDSDKLKGKVILIDFWGSWCTPCILAMPDIQKLQDHYKNNPNVAIIGISAGERDKEASLKLFNKKRYNYVLIPNGDSIAKSIYKVKDYPSLYILDRQGKIVSAEKGFTPDSFERWREIIDEQLKM
ncbi:TlpA family protein disulfide reductase [Winogradskyella haliclonae]|uniref:Thioredoxin domain-containing protein n=1 Tax=Winogradskyella haliclonae TaxID=2048558 RepID=A0ABQ2BXD9_9FLAO|nr:TlpA disulfide reductase family protein [Winogradskyella haliclonae]GGI56724.1 hypothetical protein GCM10011444_10330 [Winogradskyella haliclonae]